MIHPKFGGKWTEKKLKVLKKYLVAYATIMNKQSFKFAYIDAFAGTGYRSIKKSKNTNLSFLDIEMEANEFMKGSARIALEVEPQFQKYIFIEKNQNQFKELSKLKEGSELKNKIEIKNEEANFAIKKLCKSDWKTHRAVMFLDPFGMEIEWETIKVISDTKAIDLWVLFPLGIGVNRLLKKDGKLQEWAEKKLNKLFGDDVWKKEFYEPDKQENLFNDNHLQKKADLEIIGSYFIKRLKTVFTKVADNPAKLYNSKNSLLFLLCFAAGNPKGAKTAVKIAQDILTNI